MAIQDLVGTISNGVNGEKKCQPINCWRTQNVDPEMLEDPKDILEERPPKPATPREGDDNSQNSQRQISKRSCYFSGG